MDDLLSAFDAGFGTREASRWRLLEALRRDGPMARVELGRELSLSPATVSDLVAALVREGVLVADGEGDPAQPARGRPKQRLTIAAGLGCVVGAWVGFNRIELRLVDSAGAERARRRVDAALRDLDPEALLDAIAGAVTALRADAGGAPLAAVGVALQGYVDAGAGMLLWSPVLDARDVGVAQGLGRRLGCPVLVENDTGAAALALVQRDPRLRAGRTACLMIGDGVGFSLLVDGALYRGARSGGSEFGHARLRRGGPQCRCGRRGCVEAFLADYALHRDARLIDRGLPPAGLVPGEDTMQALVRLAEAGDEAMANLFQEAGEALADAVGIIVQMLAPDAIVLCGPGLRAYHLYEPQVRAVLERHIIPELRDLTTLHRIDFSGEDLTVGVVMQALRVLDRELARARSA